MEERIKDRNLKMTQEFVERESRVFIKNEGILWELSDPIRKSNIRLMRIKEERKKETESLFKEEIDENFPNLWEESDSHTHEASLTEKWILKAAMEIQD